MNLRFVEAFYWVASLKSISRAADKLFLTQSAMSSRIATLEEELGVLLLDRRDKQFKLTAAGARFLVYAQKLLELTVETTPILMDQIQRGTQDLVFAVLPASADGVRNRALPSMEMAFVGNPSLHKF